MTLASKFSSLVPTELSGIVFLRENVETNLRTLNRPSRKELWRAISKIVKKRSLFHAARNLDQSIRIPAKNGVAVFGTIVRAAFVAIVRIVDRTLTLLSVIDCKRLQNSKNEPSCTLVDESFDSVDVQSRVFAAVGPEKYIVWWHEMRTRIGNHRLHVAAEMVIPF